MSDYLILDSDGAAALVLVSGKKALELGLDVIAVIKGYADAAQVIKFLMLLSSSWSWIRWLTEEK